MTFPTVAATQQRSTDANTTNHTGDLPAGINADDLLLIFLGLDGPNPIDTHPSGFTILANVVTASAVRQALYAKKATGSEGATFTYVSNLNEESVSITYRIPAAEWSGDIATGIQVGTTATGSSANPNPPSVTAAWGSADNLFITIATWDDVALTHNAFPTNYSSNQLVESASADGGGVGIAVATRELAAATDDPGTHTISATEEWLANLLIIKPAGVGGNFGRNVGITRGLARGIFR